MLIPPACREEVLGDLHELYKSPARYIRNAVFTVPRVIASRIRRTADGAVAALQFAVICVCFLCTAWLMNPAFFSPESRPWRVMALSIIVIFGITIDDAYARPGYRPFFIRSEVC